MSEDQKARAERLRQEIERMKGRTVEAGEDQPEEETGIQPEETPKAYIARRSREIRRKNQPNKLS
jgi:hypothetical protein